MRSEGRDALIETVNIHGRHGSPRGMHSRKRWQAEQDQRRLKRMIREVVPEGPRMCIRGIQRDSNGARLSQQGLGVQKAAIIKLQMQETRLFPRAVGETEVLRSKSHTEGVVP